MPNHPLCPALRRFCCRGAVTISLLLQRKQEFGEILEVVCRETKGYSAERNKCLEMSSTATLAELDLGEGLTPGEADRVGYTLKTLGAGFWAFSNASSYRDGLLRIVNEG